MGIASQSFGVWAEGFYDYEKRTGRLQQNQHTSGVTSGFDRGFLWGGNQGIQFGALGGYSSTRQRLGNVTSSSNSTADFTFQFNDNNGFDQSRTYTIPFDQKDDIGTRRSIETASIGLYGSYFAGPFFLDILGKLDRGSVDQIVTITTTGPSGAAPTYRVVNGPDGQGFDNVNNVTRTAVNAQGCLSSPLVGWESGTFRLTERGDSVPGFDPRYDPLVSNDPALAASAVTLSGASSRKRTILSTTAFNTYVLANNLGVRLGLMQGYWVEPVVGTRYTFTDFASDAALLNFKDGHAFRVQGGLRIGHTSLAQDRYVMTNAIGVLFYNDVSVSGFTLNNGGSTLPTDEGKLRVQGLLQTRVQFLNGVSAYAELSGRYGEDLWALGGRVGGRIEW